MPKIFLGWTREGFIEKFENVRLSRADSSGMALKDSKEFIERFIEKEYEFSRADYNTEIPDAECEKLAADVNDFFYYREYNIVF